MGLGRLALSNILYRGANLLVSYINIILLSRLLGPRGIGETSLFIATGNLTVYILGGSLESGLIYYYTSRRIPGNRLVPLIWVMLGLQLILLWTLMSLLHGIPGLPALIGLPGPRGSSWIVPVFVISTICTHYFSSLLSGRKAFRVLNLAILGFNLSILVLIGVCALLRHHGAYPGNAVILKLYLMSFGLQGLFVAGAYLGHTGDGQWQGWHFWEDFKTLFRYARWVYLSNTLAFLALRLDFWLVGYFCGAARLGVYSQAARVGQLFFILPMVIAATILPFAIEQKESFVSHLVPLFKCIFWVNLLSGVFLCACSPLFFPGLFGQSFRYSAVCFIILMPGIFCYSLTNLPTAYFLGIRKLGPVLWESVICIGIILTGDLIFIPRYNILGASLVSSAGYLICGLYTLNVFKKTSGLKAGELIRLRKGDIHRFLEVLQSLTHPSGEHSNDPADPSDNLRKEFTL
ncbi:MAG TPA: polysaccharide biosynthesis C-terminal domain-containing protein [Chitinophagaceae bacterium]|nr:polysaccharide biosynthesis C-terminal domain-containing protein [Chitinophagaceae bacterium]